MAAPKRGERSVNVVLCIRAARLTASTVSGYNASSVLVVFARFATRDITQRRLAHRATG